MPGPRAAQAGPSIVLPNLIQGPWTSLLVLTYSANLAFFENQLLRQLSQVPLRLVLADDQRLGETLREAADTGQRLRNANRSYLLAPIRHSHAAHTKLILLSRANAGRLLIGSGNLGQDGYASPGELWHAYGYDEQNTQHLNEFAAAREMIDSLASESLLDPPLRDTLGAIWREAPWLPASPTGSPEIRHNHSTPLAQQFIDAVKAIGEPVHELTVHAPFYDTKAEALRHLIQQLNPDRIRVLLRADTSVDPQALTAVLLSANAFNLFTVSVTGDENTYIHAKWLNATTASHEVMLSGSANLSRPALLSTWATGNLEAGILHIRPAGAFDELYAPLTLTPLADLTSLDLHIETSPDTPARSGPVLLWSRLDGHRLILAFTAAFDETELVITAADGSGVSIVTATWDDLRLVVTLTPEQAAVIAEGGPLRVSLAAGNENATADVSWPYQLEHLAGRLKTATANQLLDKVGALPEPDRELYELLAQLEQSLISDPISAWKVANPTAPVPVSEGDEAGPTVKWEDIDWARLKRSPQYLAYQYRTSPGLTHTDIEVILASISAQLDPQAPTPSPQADAPEDDTDLGIESAEVAADPDRAEELEADEDPEDEEMHRALSVSTRTRMAFGRFVKRYGVALANPGFLSELGSTVTVHNAVIMHHLLGRLIERDGIDPRIAANAYLAIWTLLWGDETESGLLSGLDLEERDVADQLIAQGRLREMTIRALADYARDADMLEELRPQLRRVAQHLAVDSDFALSKELCETAVAGRGQKTVRSLWDLASHLEAAEAIAYALEPLGLPPAAAHWATAQVNRAGAKGDRARRATVRVLEITKPAPGLTIALAREVLSRLAMTSRFNNDPDDYSRIKFPEKGDVCFWDEAASDGLIQIAGQSTDIASLETPWPDWHRRLEELHEALAGEVAA